MAPSAIGRRDTGRPCVRRAATGEANRSEARPPGGYLRLTWPRFAPSAGTCHAARMPDDRAPSEVVRPLVRTRQFREFTDEAPTDAQLEAILDAARWTGSAGNEQPWRFVVVRDRERI